MKITCIIPAFNEAARIGSVLDVITSHPDIYETIVIDDASTDGTSEVTAKYPVKLITKSKNGGKSKAIYDGINASTGDFLLFIDADLIGLSTKDISAMIEPIANNRADISISLRKNSPWHWLGFDYISGERLMPKDLFESHVPDLLKLRPFGLEVFKNTLIVQKKYRIAIVEWSDVISPIKIAKDGLWKGVRGDIKMMRDIFLTVNPFSILRQLYSMYRQIVR